MIKCEANPNRIRVFRFFLLVLMLSFIPVSSGAAQSLQAGGYLVLQPVHIQSEDIQSREVNSWWDYRFQQRLNLGLELTEELSLVSESRLRFFAGDLVRQVPDYARIIAADDGLVKAGWLLTERSDWFMHLMADRLYLAYTTENVTLTAGRQRIHWGLGMLTNPNDVFNVYSLYDFDHPERPGTDAVRLQYYLDWSEHIEIAFSPNRDNVYLSTAGILYAFNRREVDYQVLAGVYQKKIFLGGGWAGSLLNAGFKGEITSYWSGNPFQHDVVTLVAAVSAEYMFGSGLFVVSEVVWNSLPGRATGILFTDLRPDSPTLTQWQGALSISKQLNPLVTAGATVVGYPDERAVFFSPTLTLSLHEDLDFSLVMQRIVASDASVFAGNASVTAFALRYNY